MYKYNIYFEVDCEWVTNGDSIELTSPATQATVEELSAQYGTSVALALEVV